MADNKKQNQKNTPKKKISLAAGGTRRSTATVTAKSTYKAQKKVKKSSASGKKNDPNRGEGRRRFCEQYVPYILGAVSLFLLVCFVLHFIRPDAGPTEHLMGPVGYGICYFLFGLLGWVAVLLPVLLGLLAVLWRRYYNDGTVVIKTVLTAVALVYISAVLHVFVCGGSHISHDIPKLYADGAALQSGGVIGGLLGWLLYTALRLPGTIVLTVVLLPLLIMFILNMTPAYVFAKIKKMVIEARDEMAAKAAAAESSEDDEDEDEEEEPTPKKRRPPMKEASPEELYVPGQRQGSSASDSPIKDKRAKSMEVAGRKGNTIRVNTDTGEVLDDPATEADELYVPGQARAAALAEDDRAPWMEPTASSAPAREAAQETPSATSHKATPEEDAAVASAAASDIAPATAAGQVAPATEAEDTAADLYVPPHPAKAHRADSMVNPVYDDENENAHESVDFMEISIQDDGKPHIVVNVLPQDRTALTDSSDYRINGLADEETVVPSGHTPGADGAEEAEVGKEYAFPPLDLLTRGPDHYEADESEIIKNTQALRSVLESFHIRVKDIDCSCGPTITRYEVKPDVGVRVRSIANLVDDIALGLAKSGVRIEAPIPGKSAVGIEVPNANPSTVALRNLLETPEFMGHKSRIAACLGADVAGRPVIMDINKMPHLLVAGATGSGKSVCINSIIMSIIYKAKPEEVKLILIDPKKVEFAVYRDLPHLYAPIVSDPKKAAGCLNSAVNEMERRFELIEEVGVRNLAGYNEVTAGDPERPPLPQMVIIIDELADLMMTVSNEVETAICRLAQKARAAGIHLILGTQRPSTDVITGLIKANIPSRIAFTVASQIDSRTIIDSMGAEKLIGRGDMLYAPVGVTKPLRVQGAFVSDSEVEKVVTYLKEHNERVPFDENFMRSIEIEAAKCGSGKKGDDDGGSMAHGDGGEDGMFWDAVEVFVDAQRASTSLLQRRFGIGYGKAAKLIDQMEEMGLVGPADGNKPRKMLVTKQELMEMRMNGGGAAEE